MRKPSREIRKLVRGSVEETLNELLEAEAEKLAQAARYERNGRRQGYRSGHYSRNLTTTSGDVTVKVPQLKGASFFQWLRGRGLSGVKLVVGDKCLGMLEAVGEVVPRPNTNGARPIFTAMCSL